MADEDFEVLVTPGVAGMTVTPDGRHAIIQFETEVDGASLTVAFPAKGLHSLAALAIQMTDRINRARGEALIQAFDVARWSASQAHDGHVLLALDLPSGGQLAFRLHPNASRQLGEALVERGTSQPLAPDSARH